MAANTGEPTRQSRAPPYTRSTPDVTLHHARWTGRVHWKTVEEMSSDHLPIVVDIQTSGRPSRRRAPTRPSYRKADWGIYEETLDREIRNLPDWDNHTSIKAATEQFNRVVTKAAAAAIPKGGRVCPQPWWTEEIGKAVKRRNRLRRAARRDPAQGEAWSRAEQEVRKLIREARQESWRNFASELNLRTDARKVWSVIHRIDGKEPTGRQDEAMTVGGRTLTADTHKANAFIKEYARVSHLSPRVKEDRPYRHAVTNHLKRPCQECRGERTSCCSPFSRTELDAALGRLAGRKAPGLDGITNEMLVHLSDLAREKLLELINMTWTRGELPTAWKRAVIVPIHKKGKPRGKIGSYRPISLLSCVGKLSERLVQARLYHLLESRQLLNPAQAGFRKARSTEDQVLRVTQVVADGFQRRERTVMVLVDFQRAFDKAWHTGILYKLIGMDIPRCYTAWVRAFLNDRLACVRYNGQRGGFRRIREGTPQGAVCSPLLFLTFINDITDHFPPGVQTSLFADDLAVWATDKSITEAEAKVQTALNELKKWADTWKMTISTEKTVGTIFTLDPSEAKRESQLKLDAVQLQHEATPTFLGVKFDRTLSFRQHTEDLKAKMAKRTNTMRALSGKTWGSATSNLRTVYTAFVRSCAEYAAAGWMPGMAPSNLEHLEVAQRRGCRVITGCLKSTPTAALEREADQLPFSVRRRQLAAVAVQRHRRDIPGDPLQPLLTTTRPTLRLHQDRGWADTGLAVSAQAGLENLPKEAQLVVPESAPWEPVPATITMKSTLYKPTKKTDPPETRLAAAQETLRRLPPADATVYTDGSAERGQENGGGGAVVVREGREVKRLKVPAGRFTSSYRAELAALAEALSFLQAANRRWGLRRVLICTDSQSAIRRLEAGPAGQTDALTNRIWNLLKAVNEGGAEIHLQWVPGHSGLPGNEIADEVARAAAEADQSHAPIDLSSAKSRLRQQAQTEWTKHMEKTRYHARNGPRRVTPGDKQGLTRAESVEAARLRTGHSLLLRSYRMRIGQVDDDICPECEEDAETLEHLLTACPARASLRRSIFGRDDPTVPEALGDPHRLVELIGRLGRL